MPKSHYLSAFFLGALATLALPPLHILPLLIPAFSGLLYLLDKCAKRKTAFLVGWWFGFGHFFTGFYWIAISLFTDIVQFGWLLPFTVLGIPAAIALYTGVVTWVVWRTSLEGWRRVVMLAIAWTLVEYARGYLFTGFPWNLIGYSMAISTGMLQITSITGIYGLSFLTVLLAAIPFTIREYSRRIWMPSLIVYSIGSLVLSYGIFRLVQHPESHTDKTVRLVQANIAQDHKWKPELLFNTLETHWKLTQTPAENPADIVVWPESAVPYMLNTEPALPSYLGKALSPSAILITGALRAERTPQFQLWNTVYVLDQHGQILTHYDKFHLVPFGEYIPLRSLLPLNKITHGTTDFSTGPGPQTLAVKDLPTFSPLICYEAIFPGKATDKTMRPAWMVNVTNDAWFGTSSGPYQHFTMARVRAIEEGVPLLRAANTGISGIVDSYGRVIARLGLNQQGVVDGYLPTALSTPTLYSRYGDRMLFLVLVASGVIIVARRSWM